MSRTVRRKLFQELEALKNINLSLENLFDKGKRESLIAVLTECQNQAILIGNEIEAVYGDDYKSVHLLEDYCEMIYELAQNIEVSDKYKVLYHMTVQQLLTVQKGMKKEIPDRLEAVFLPYKAAMWDSLESIWFAAKEDVKCETYVIPIPYYDKNPDGSFRQEYYEGKELPKYVPVTGYEEYDFELRKPDIIFIHNPYDQGNYVTSVHPYFYSKNLKQFTEKLVYVPYFVLDGSGVEEKYVLTTGVLNADYVIVQNEKEKEDYIRHFRAVYPQLEIADKLLPLGSPKFDRVCALNRYNVAAPQEWLERIESKKVILYNTSVSAVLENIERYLKKLESVFLLFKGREDTILLWRPHPLMESTILSMRPSFMKKYMELKNWFIEQNIGIYDDTPDMYTAIGLSDAYYGDWSSMVWLYRQTGKPVMIQNINSV